MLNGNGTSTSSADKEFNRTQFVKQLRAVIEHNGADVRAGTSSIILADFIDHALQALSRALQDEQLRAEQERRQIVEAQQPDLESRWMNELLGTDSVPDQSITSSLAAPKFQPTKIAAQSFQIYELRREDQSDDQATFEAAIALVNSAPSPVTVRVTLNGVPAIEGISIGEGFSIGAIYYEVINILPTKELLLLRLSSGVAEGN